MRLASVCAGGNTSQVAGLLAAGGELVLRTVPLEPPLDVLHSFQGPNLPTGLHGHVMSGLGRWVGAKVVLF